MSLRQDSDAKLRKEKKKMARRITSAEEYDEMENHFLKKQAIKDEPDMLGTVHIIAGKAKGVKIQIPRGCRPVTNRMKTNLFDVLREDIANRTVLDLYAGSGSFGLEAMSRGAKSATFVDATKHAERALIDNVKAAAFMVDTKIIRSKAEEFLPQAIFDEEKYEVIFMDPPYKFFNKKDLKKIQNLLELAAELLPGTKDWNTKMYKGVIIVKHPRMYPIENLQIPTLNLFETFNFGSNSLTFFAVKELNK
jgi:16S rRNA (guanine966-N2)-methyltransferase